MLDDRTQQVLLAWSRYSESTESLVHLSHEGLTLQAALPSELRAAGADAQALRYAEHCAKYARREIDEGFRTVHAHALLGLWGALECFVEDIFVATLLRDARLLTGDGFAKVRLPVATLLVADEEERMRAILVEISRAPADSGRGVNKFERVLEAVALGGRVPERVRDSIFQAQQVRNVWAHRGGIADAKFVQSCPRLGFESGEVVAMPSDLFLHLMHGLHMYGAIVFMRLAASLNLPTDRVECHGYEGVLAEAGFSGS